MMTHDLWEHNRSSDERHWLRRKDVAPSIVTRILVSKRAADRPKDRLVVPVLEEVVALRAARSGGSD